MGALISRFKCAARHPARLVCCAAAIAYPMKVSAKPHEATKSMEPAAQDMAQHLVAPRLCAHPNNPGPGFWVIGENLRLMQRQKPGVMHVDLSPATPTAAAPKPRPRCSVPRCFWLRGATP